MSFPFVFFYHFVDIESPPCLQAALSFVFLLASVIGLWRIEDKLFIKQELKLGLGFSLPVFVVWVSGVASGKIPTDALQGLIDFIILALHVISVIFPTALVISSSGWRALRSGFHLKQEGWRQNKLHAGGLAADEEKSLKESRPSGERPKDLLEAVLEHPELLASLEDFCVQSFCVEK